MVLCKEELRSQFRKIQTLHACLWMAGLKGFRYGADWYPMQRSGWKQMEYNLNTNVHKGRTKN